MCCIPLSFFFSFSFVPMEDRVGGPGKYLYKKGDSGSSSSSGSLPGPAARLWVWVWVPLPATPTFHRRLHSQRCWQWYGIRYGGLKTENQRHEIAGAIWCIYELITVHKANCFPL